MQKVQRTESVPEITVSPEALQTLPADHPRKKAVSSVAAEKDLPTTTSVQNMMKIKNEINMCEDVFKKLQKETGAFQFLPLSSGKALLNLWWEVTDCRPAESKKGSSESWFYITTNILLDIGGNIVLPQNSCMKFTFKVNFLDVLRMCYLYEAFSAALRACAGWLSFDSWLVERQKELPSGQVVSESGVVMSLYRKTFAEELPVPRTFRPFFSKSAHNTVIFPENVIVQENRNCVVCETSKPDFKYEIRIRLFNISDAMLREKCKKFEEEFPESQVF